MKRFYLFFIIAVFSSLSFSCKKNGFEIEIKSTTVKNGKLFISSEIRNNSNNKVYFPIYTTEMLIPYHNLRNQSKMPLDSLYSPSLILLIYDKKGEIIPGIYGFDENYFGNKFEKEPIDSIDFYFSKIDTAKLNMDEKSFLRSKYLIQVFQYVNIKNESFYVNPKSSITINFASHLNYSSTRAELLIDDLSFYPTDVFREASDYNVTLNIDSTLVKKRFTKEFIDSLHQNNIKIFHGTIYSNKVPLIKE